MVKSFFVCVAALSAIVLFQNCSKKEFNRVDPVAKASVLGAHMSETEDAGVETEDTTTVPTTNGQDLKFEVDGMSGLGTKDNRDETGGNQGADNTISADQPVVKVDMWCRGANEGEALVNQTSAILSVKHGQTELCSVDVLDSLKNGSDLNLSSCNLKSVPKGSTILISLKSGAGRNLLFVNGRRSAGQIPLLLRKGITSAAAAADARCESYTGSPLVVDMRPKHELVSLFQMSAPEDGELFDILGLNSHPAPYAKKQISVVEDSRVMFLVLPNGKEAGIDQLFGDNTLGPDGKFAANGFKALAKYDGYSFSDKKVTGDVDGVITEDDEVYSKLRLWSDKNFNYKIDAGELIPLKNAKLAVIDLDYDADYYSQDKYGNEYKFKSVVKMKDSELRPIFDIWFVIKKSLQ